MNEEDTFPERGTKSELEKIGARHLSSDPLEIDGIRGQIEYMIYQKGNVGIVWKKPINSDIYLIHERARIEKRYPVPATV